MKKHQIKPELCLNGSEIWPSPRSLLTSSDGERCIKGTCATLAPPRGERDAPLGTLISVGQDAWLGLERGGETWSLPLVNPRLQPFSGWHQLHVISLQSLVGRFRPVPSGMAEKHQWHRTKTSCFSPLLANLCPFPWSSSKGVVWDPSFYSSKSLL